MSEKNGPRLFTEIYDDVSWLYSFGMLIGALVVPIILGAVGILLAMLINLFKYGVFGLC